MLGATRVPPSGNDLSKRKVSAAPDSAPLLVQSSYHRYADRNLGSIKKLTTAAKPRGEVASTLLLAPQNLFGLSSD